ncbi:hypothetical protein [Aliiroseovarius marinus]|uniref:hypothetical protein n=1 Tax=Aliiroseovarius marinus TaxID=2500159 RepID=UPI00105EED3B|nr:hypothetical protein [Aliiroseovarius marinus]
MTITAFIKGSWDAVMDESQNPLRNYSLPTAHMLMQVLAWMWSAVFSISVGSYFVFGVTAIGHVLLIAGVFITLMVFRKADSQN